MLFSRKQEPTIGSGQVSHVTKNPYLGEMGRREWNDRYGVMAKNTRGWQGAFGVAMVAVIALTVVNLKLSTQSHIQPFVVEMNKGVPVAVSPMTPIALNNEAIIHYAVNQFIRDVREVIVDPIAEKKALNRVYAFAADKTLPYLKEYYTINNPLERAKTVSVDVDAFNILPMSENTCQAMWDEIERDSMTNAIIKKTRWIANVTYQFGAVNPELINDNPFGLYITHITWSQSQDGVQ